MVVADEPSTVEIAARLLVHLRTELGRPELSYAEPPARVAGGNETFIYSFGLRDAPTDLSRPLILRAYREGYARPDQARWESTVQNAIAGLGYPAARALFVCPSSAVLGTPFFVMERLPGTTMLQGAGELDERGQMRFARYKVILRAPALIANIPRVCAEAQVWLHSLDAEAVLRAFESAGLPTSMLSFDGRLEDLRRRVEESSLDGLRDAVAWLFEHKPHAPERLAICHGDTQPNNILIAGGAITGVIDWSQALVADPAFDVGYTKVAFETAPLQLPVLLQWAARPIGRRLAGRFVRAYRRSLPVSAEAVEYYGAFRCILALAFIGARRLAGRSEPDIWDSSAGLTNLIARVRSVTGITPSIPPDARPRNRAPD